MAARFTRLVVGLGLLLGAALPSAAAAVVRPPTSQETAASPVPARGADPAYARSYFGARYYRADLGRFTTVDPVLDQQAALTDPQLWNRYAYVRNNPLRWVDPDGRAIELLNGGRDLAFFQGLVGEDAAKLLYVNKIGNRSFLGIRGDMDTFRALSDQAGLVGLLVKDRAVMEFATTTEDLSAHLGAVTHAPGVVGNDNVRVLVNPSQANLASAYFQRGFGQVQFGAGEVQDYSPGIMFAHEMGHAFSFIHGRQRKRVISPDTDAGALMFENRARQWSYGPLGPGNAPRLRHSPWGAIIWP